MPSAMAAIRRTASRPAQQAAPAGRAAARLPRMDGDEALMRRVAASHNLDEAAYQRIVKILGRRPSLTEIGVFGVMWSEHCSYCSSKPYLKTFPTKGRRILVPAGAENAGLVDVGDGIGVAFKIESHNHPSAVEPHAGAATGVGGIIRDIFTMGARPIALFNALRFAPLKGDARTQYLFGGVVKGIADYGNAVGVPTVGGEIVFDESYRENPLVNVMCIGVVEANKIARARASGLGNPVIYVGSSTGRDGLGGASFASRELTTSSEADRPAVQIGDPFAEKCLIEATLEALATGDVVGIQDMGAAGLTCSTAETAARGGRGIEIDVLKVPRREAGLAPYEVMLSESQERMLVIAKRGTERGIMRLFQKWGLSAVVIGRVTADDRMRVFEGKDLVADIPALALTDEAPIYHRPVKRPAYLDKVQALSLAQVPEPNDMNRALEQLLASPTVADKHFVYEQYDHMVQTNTVVLPGRADAAVLRLKGTSRLLAAATGGSGRYCYLDPYEGGKLAVAEVARNVACVGAAPLAVTDCLNFGNPQDPEIMWQFKEAVRGISDACRAFETPVTGGNVSLYNEGPSGAIDPTPVIGMIGLIEGTGGTPAPLTAGFKEAGDVIVLLGEPREELGGSEYLMVIHGRKAGKPPRVDLAHEKRLQQLLVAAHRQQLLQSAHDCSEGGFAVALAESCVMDRGRLFGARVAPATIGMRADAWLFGETAGRVIVSCQPHQAGRLVELAKRRQVPAASIGTVGGERLVIGEWIDLPVARLADVWLRALERQLS